MARKKPCDYCNSEKINTYEGRNGHGLIVEFYPDNCLLAVSSFGNDANGESDELSWDVERNYFPFCGRKLGY